MADRSLNMKRVKSAIVWGSLILGILVVSVLSIQKKANAEVKLLNIEIKGIAGDQQMISESEVKKILMKAHGAPLTKANIKTVNTRKLESKLRKDKRVARADIYLDAKNRLHVIVMQREPLMRVVVDGGHDYYIDHNGKAIPVTVGSAVRVPIISGITEEYTSKFALTDKPSKLKDMYHIMKYVSQDAFLTSLVEQAYVSQDSIGDIILVPKVGRERLILGDASNLEEKFSKLKIFYKEGLPRIGWNRYTSLNLKYASQVSGKLADPNAPKLYKVETAQDSVQMATTSISNNESSIHN
jgi:cell division protein FtsQ